MDINAQGKPTVKKITRPWMAQFSKLKVFLKRFGHCNVKKGRLGQWVCRQRYLQRKGLLSENRVRLLDDLGFVWYWQAFRVRKTWLKKFGRLQAFKRRFGHCEVTYNWKRDPALVIWVYYQRRCQKKGLLNEEQTRLLDSIGFPWHATRKHLTNSKVWMRQYRVLVRYVRRYGNSLVPRTYQDRTLANWVWTQRQRRRNTNNRGGPLSEAQVGLLDALGFRWDGRKDRADELWTTRLSQLEEFKKRFGHSNVPSRWEKNPILANWVAVQRRRRKRGLLKEDQIRHLDELGFVWDISSMRKPTPRIWMERYRTLVQYAHRHRDANVPFSYRDQKLVRWIANQRARQRGYDKHKGLLSEEQVRLLDTLNFSWDPSKEWWEQSLTELRQYLAKHGTILPTRRNLRLYRWVQNQRKRYKKGTLSAEQIRCLKELELL